MSFFKGKSVLLVDHRPRRAKAIAATLKKTWAAEIEIVKSCEKANEIAQNRDARFDFDVVIVAFGIGNYLQLLRGLNPKPGRVFCDTLRPAEGNPAVLHSSTRSGSPPAFGSICRPAPGLIIGRTVTIGTTCQIASSHNFDPVEDSMSGGFTSNSPSTSNHCVSPALTGDESCRFADPC